MISFRADEFFRAESGSEIASSIEWTLALLIRLNQDTNVLAH